MKINLENRVYKIGDQVYCGYTRLHVQEQRGRRFVKYKGRQRNLKDIPVLPPPPPDPVLDYIFGGRFLSHPCPAMDYWILRYRMKEQITIEEFKNRKSFTSPFYQMMNQDNRR